MYIDPPLKEETKRQLPGDRRSHQVASSIFCFSVSTSFGAIVGAKLTAGVGTLQQQRLLLFRTPLPPSHVGFLWLDIYITTAVNALTVDRFQVQTLLYFPGSFCTFPSFYIKPARFVFTAIVNPALYVIVFPALHASFSL